MPAEVHSMEEQTTWKPHFSQVFGARSAELEQHEIEALMLEEESAEKSRRERRRALIVPREHGAWGLLLVPMITAAGIGLRASSNPFPFLLLLTAAITLFWLRTPLESYLGTSLVRAQSTEERRDVLFAAVYLAAIAALALAMLLRDGANPLLWYLGLAAGAAFGAQALVKTWKRSPRPSRPSEAGPARSKHSAMNSRMLSEIIGTVGLTAAAPAAYYVITGKLDSTAWMLWLVNLLFAGNQIHYVQLRIHSARVEGFGNKLAKGWAFVVGEMVMAGILLLMCSAGLMPWIALVAFVPLLLRGFIYFFQKPSPLLVRRLGWTELAQAVIFCILLVVTI